MDNEVTNFMQIWVEEYTNKLIDKSDVCKCSQCKKDIYTYSLNHLPPHYATNVKGKVLAKYKVLDSQFEADMFRVITEAIEIVKNNPNH